MVDTQFLFFVLLCHRSEDINVNNKTLTTSAPAKFRSTLIIELTVRLRYIVFVRITIVSTVNNFDNNIVLISHNIISDFNSFSVQIARMLWITRNSECVVYVALFLLQLGATSSINLEKKIVKDY